MKNNRILIIPDAYLNNYSGAYVTRIAKKLLLSLGHEVAIFSDETDRVINEEDGVIVYPRRKADLKAHWKDTVYREEYIKVLDTFRPDVVFTIGSVTNKPSCYWRIARERGIKTVSKILMQDFFCTKFYANDESGLCTKCLDHGFGSVFFAKCHPYKQKSLSNILRTLMAVSARKKIQRELRQADAVITSSRQQVEFYVKYGIPRERCYITPLYFNGDKLKKYEPSMGDYYVFVAQNRIDKGIHLLKDILAACNKEVKVVAAYTSQQRIDEAIDKYGLRPFVESGILEMRPNCTWTTDLGEVMAKSRGVVNPSIWPTTTEYVLLETLGLKKPIFTYNVGIHSEIIVSGENGFVAENSHQMAEQLNSFLHDDALYEKVSSNAFLLYKQLTDIEGWRKTLKHILERIF